MAMRPLAFNGIATRLGGQKIAVRGLRSNHRLPGQSNWWNPCGIADGYFTNLAPDSGATGQPDIPGARAGLYEDTGIVNASVELTWNGVDHVGAGPAACINPDADDFGLGLWFENNIYGGVVALWALGRRPSDIRLIATAPDAGYYSGQPIVLRMDVTGDIVKCYRDGDLMITETVPAELAGSAIHGLSVDVNGMSPRLPNAPCAPSDSYSVTDISTGWMFEGGEWQAAGRWIDEAEFAA